MELASRSCRVRRMFGSGGSPNSGHSRSLSGVGCSQVRCLYCWLAASKRQGREGRSDGPSAVHADPSCACEFSRFDATFGARRPASGAKTHIIRSMAKLNARDRAHLVVLAYESGLVAHGTPDIHLANRSPGARATPAGATAPGRNRIHLIV